MAVSVFHRFSHLFLGTCFSSSIFFESISAILIIHTCAIEQLESVVKELYRESGNNKWPLILLHKRRVRALLENPTHRNLVEEWISNGVLYATPPGSNDDWYELLAFLTVPLVRQKNTNNVWLLHSSFVFEPPQVLAVCCCQAQVFACDK